MLKSFILLGLRNIRKNKILSVFSIFGLSLSIGCAIVIFIFINFEYNVDHFHVDVDRIFLVTQAEESKQGVDVYGRVSFPVGKALKDQFSQVEEMVRLNQRNAVVEVESKDPLYEQVTFADASFFSVFTFPMKWGSALSLKDPAQVILSEETAQKYFGQDNPVGQVVKFRFDNGYEASAVVGGVAEAFPKKRSFDFSMLINNSTWDKVGDAPDDWKTLCDATFIKARTGDLTLPDGLKDAVTAYNAVHVDAPIQRYGFQPLSTLARESYRIRGDIAKGYGPPSGKVALSIMGLLLITLSCLNYINSATATAATRLKEIGIRKVIGSRRTSIMLQFMVENIVLNCFALIVGIFLARFLLLPGFDGLFQIGLEFEIGDGSLWLFFLALLGVTSLLSGAYPAFYISHFKPVTILSGRQSLGTKSFFSKLLLFFQFKLSFLYIVAAIIFVANERFQKNKDWGYDHRDLLVVAPADERAYQHFVKALPQHPDVMRLSSAQQHIGYNVEDVSVYVEGDAVKSLLLDVDSTYLETMGVRVVKGSSFAVNQEAGHRNVIINEAFARKMNWPDPLNHTLKMDDATYYVTGVVADFQAGNFQTRIEPTVLRLALEDRYYHYVVVRAEQGTSAKVLAHVRSLWHEVSPEVPFGGYHQDEAFQGYFALISGHGKVILFSAFMAVTLACFGLFGLVYFNVMSRLKDYSIMKVLGMGTGRLVRKVVRIFIWVLIIALVISFPLSLFSTKMLFDVVYGDHIPITLVYPFVAVILMLLICLGTVSFLIVKLAKQNPVHSLRSE
jgi:ABC-type antimicrobial peptide transport system permease subunit